MLKLIITFGIILNINAQSIEKTSVKISVKNNTQSTFKFNQKLKILKGINFVATPQLGNLFLTRFEAEKARINLNDYYNDYDFGLKVGLSSILKKNLKMKALYNVGMIKFDKPLFDRAKGYFVQISVDYAF